MLLVWFSTAVVVANMVHGLSTVVLIVRFLTLGLVWCVPCLDYPPFGVLPRVPVQRTMYGDGHGYYVRLKTASSVVVVVWLRRTSQERSLSPFCLLFWSSYIPNG